MWWLFSLQLTDPPLSLKPLPDTAALSALLIFSVSHPGIVLTLVFSGLTLWSVEPCLCFKMNTGRKRTTLLTIRCVAQYGCLEKAFTRYSYIKCDKSKLQRSVFISSREQREWPLSWRGRCSLASPAANCLLCLLAQAHLSTTDHLGLCNFSESRALGCVIKTKKVTIDGDTRYRPTWLGKSYRGHGRMN